MRLAEIAAVSSAVANTPGRLQKTAQLADRLKSAPLDELEIVLGFLSGSPRQRRLGVGGALIRSAASAPPATCPSLTVRDVDEVLEKVSLAAGAGSTAVRAEQLHDLFRRATSDEQNFLTRLLYGELRQGALEGVLVEAVARASGVPAQTIRRAAMLEGSLAPVAKIALAEGETGLGRSVVRPFRPIQPMLAESAPDVEAAVAELSDATLEFKLDGARIQVHKVDDEVRVCSRTRRDVTMAVPEVVDVLRRVSARTIVLDGEAIAMRSDQKPHPFQMTMKRFGRRLDVDRLRQTLPIAPFFFDCLYADDASLIDEPLARRVEVLDGLIDSTHLVPRVLPSSTGEAVAFMDRALATGHEGVMAKALGGTYAAGRRGQAWLKVKRARTLDLVVLAVEWGSGRRTGTLSNLHLGARDAERGAFVMLGKTFKGLTDAQLEWQTKRLLALEIGRDGHTIHVRPELVVEIAFNDLQESPHYPGGLALRFARVKRYREDKAASAADTMQTVRRIYEEMTGLPAPVR